MLASKLLGSHPVVEDLAHHREFELERIPRLRRFGHQRLPAIQPPPVMQIAHRPLAQPQMIRRGTITPTLLEQRYRRITLRFGQQTPWMQKSTPQNKELDFSVQLLGTTSLPC